MTDSSKRTDDFSKVDSRSVENKKKDKSIDELTSEIVSLEKQIREERFIGIIIFIVLFNIIILIKTASWALVIITAIFELVLIIPIGRRLKILFIEHLLEKILNTLKK